MLSEDVLCKFVLVNIGVFDVLHRRRRCHQLKRGIRVVLVLQDAKPSRAPEIDHDISPLSFIVARQVPGITVAHNLEQMVLLFVLGTSMI